MKYAVIEKGETSPGAYVPDLPGALPQIRHAKKYYALFTKQSNFIFRDLRKMVKLYQDPLSALNSSK